MKTAQPIRNKHQIRELANYFLGRGEIRNHILVVMGVHTALRISDLLRLTWNDVYDFERQRVRKSIVITEKKTGKSKTISLNKSIVTALSIYSYAAKQGCVLIVSRKGENKAVSRQQAHHIISKAAEALGFAFKVSCHSMRKTFGYHSWKSGVSPAIIMEIYNHSSFAITRRYLGVTQDDKDDVYLKLELLV